MTINVRYFARLRDLAGQDTETVELASSVTDGTSLFDWLTARDARFGDALAHPSVRVEVNGVIGPRETPIADGDEVALLPPFSGG